MIACHPCWKSRQQFNITRERVNDRTIHWIWIFFFFRKLYLKTSELHPPLHFSNWRIIILQTNMREENERQQMHLLNLIYGKILFRVRKHSHNRIVPHTHIDDVYKNIWNTKEEWKMCSSDFLYENDSVFHIFQPRTTVKRFLGY